jgi:uncharacterized ferritin-like protein (DUF455 family)
MELRAQALNCLAKTEFFDKTQAVAELSSAWASGSCGIDTSIVFNAPNNIPGLPSKLDLVSPKDVARRNMRTIDGRAIMIHALAHIEFNAINLALDAIWRFADMPEDYYVDWLKVAAEEAYHFTLLNEHLIKLGYVYGDFPAHNSLWEMAAKTTDDILARIALVPRTMEARGLDASPALRAKLAQVGDIEAAEILDIILRDEIGHVAIGNLWFNWLCETRGLEPISAYASLAKQYEAPTPRKPFNHQARLAAGFTEQELAWLENA